MNKKARSIGQEVDKGEEKPTKSLADAFDELNLLKDLDHEVYTKVTQLLIIDMKVRLIFLPMLEITKRDCLKNLQLLWWCIWEGGS